MTNRSPLPRVHVESHRVIISLPISSSDPPPAAESPPQLPPIDLAHSTDFSAVRWHGETFTFSRKQRLVIAALWSARRDGYDWVSQENLLDAAESDGGKLRNLFGRHPAWGTLIVSGMDHGGTPGTYRLAV